MCGIAALQRANEHAWAFARAVAPDGGVQRGAADADAIRKEGEVGGVRLVRDVEEGAEARGGEDGEDGEEERAPPEESPGEGALEAAGRGAGHEKGLGSW